MTINAQNVKYILEIGPYNDQVNLILESILGNSLIYYTKWTN